MAAEAAETSLGKLFRREMTAKPPPHSPRWITVRTEAGPMQAIAFVMDRRSHRYVGGLTPEKAAEILALAAGHWGTGADYLYSTVKHLEDLGIHDRYLWRQQELVARQINKSPMRSSP